MTKRWKVELDFDAEALRALSRENGMGELTWERFEREFIVALTPAMGPLPPGAVVVRSWEED